MACTLLAVLFAVALPATSRISGYAQRTRSISNLRQLGVAAHLYTNDHDQELPGQIPAGDLPSAARGSSPQWPALLCSYLSPSDPTVLLDPGDISASHLSIHDILSNVTNQTGYIYNGFNDLSVNGHPPAVIRLNRLTNPGEVVLLAQKKRGAVAFCLSPIFQPVTNLLDLLNPGAYDGGSHYLFVDGSVRFMKWEDYSNKLWLVDKGGSLPLPPLPPLPGDGNDGSRAALPLATLR